MLQRKKTFAKSRGFGRQKLTIFDFFSQLKITLEGKD